MDKLGVFHANQTSMRLDPHLNYTRPRSAVSNTSGNGPILSLRLIIK